MKTSKNAAVTGPVCHRGANTATSESHLLTKWRLCCWGDPRI